MNRFIAAAGAGLTSGALLFAAVGSSSNRERNHLLPLATVCHAETTPKCFNDGPLPTRAELLEKLKQTDEFDILIIGGGATGSGVALDAQTRGLKTALVEKFDYSSGTSSRSTKLIHGGVRYLEKAFLNLDYQQYKLVREALNERANLLKSAPHLSNPIPIMIPVYKWWQVPYFWAGIKAYDLVAGRKLVHSSYFLSKKKALQKFPMLKDDKLCGAIVYYDGQQDDARVNLSLVLSAIRQGAVASNYVEVTKLLKKTEKTADGSKKSVVCGATVRDTVTGNEWDVKAKSVVNATGPFTDSIRQMDNPSTQKICQASSGVHLIFPDYYCPRDIGLLDPSTSDGRVIFFLPWEGKTVAGTTDHPTEVTFEPHPTEKEIDFILQEVSGYFNSNFKVRRGDVQSAWSGLRPLVKDPSSKNTQSISRHHVIEVSDSNLITIAGGKWTTYRAMALDTVDKAVATNGLQETNASQTGTLVLDGGEGWTPDHYVSLVQEFGLDVEVAKHLSSSYGNKAAEVAKLAKLTGKQWPVVGKRLTNDLPYIEAEVVYATKEYAVSAVDVVARRLRMAFLNSEATSAVLPRIVDILGDSLHWNKAQRQEEIEKGRKFLEVEMGKLPRQQATEYSLTKEEVEKCTQAFHEIDNSRSGHIDAAALKKKMHSLGETQVTDEDAKQFVTEVDYNGNSKIELEEFLQLMSLTKENVVTNNGLVALVRKHYNLSLNNAEATQLPS